MRILQVSAYFLPSYRGTEQTVANLSLALHQLGHDVSVLTVNTEGALECENWEGIPVRRTKRGLSYRRAAFSPQLGREAIRARGFDIYHIHLPFQTGLEMLAMASLVNGIPLVANHHGEGPAVGVLHGAIRGLYNAFYRSVGLSRVERLVFFTKSYPESLGFSKRILHKTRTIPPAVDCNLFRPAGDKAALRRELGLDPAHKVVLFVSGLSFRDWRRHGDYVLSAVAMARQRIPGISLVIVGEGELLPALQKQAAELGLGQNAHFPGRVQGKRLAEYYAASDLFAFPSTYESFGYVVMEAMASGLPSIVCDIPGVGELVTPGETGLRVPPDDISALANAMAFLLQDERMRLKMGVEARMKAESRTWRQVAEETVGVYEEVTGQRGRARVSTGATRQCGR